VRTFQKINLGSVNVICEHGERDSQKSWKPPRDAVARVRGAAGLMEGLSVKGGSERGLMEGRTGFEGGSD
jgi:hypothetical protein